jgi:hypothetical protein
VEGEAGEYHWREEGVIDEGEENLGLKRHWY